MVYEEAMNNKELAAKILIPLIEFEFEFLGCEQPRLSQATKNKEQLNVIFEICKKHGWLALNQISDKRNCLSITISSKGFREIYSIGGKFADSEKRKWAELLNERNATRGGYRKDMPSTRERVLEAMLKEPEKNWSTTELSFLLRLMPGTIRETMRDLLNENKIAKSVGNGRGNPASYRLIHNQKPYSTEPHQG